MKVFFGASLVAALGLATLVAAQTEGLNNSSKRFTDPAQVGIDDMDDPAQIRRTWDAAIVMVPAGPGRSLAAVPGCQAGVSGQVQGCAWARRVHLRRTLAAPTDNTAADGLGEVCSGLRAEPRGHPSTIRVPSRAVAMPATHGTRVDYCGGHGYATRYHRHVHRRSRR